MAENGFNFARIRVLNNPGKGHGNEYYLPEGYQDPDDCLAMARRAKDKGMQIDLHLHILILGRTVKISLFHMIGVRILREII